MYLVVMDAARAEGIGAHERPDLLGSGFHLLGQEELSDRDLEAAVEPRLGQLAGKMGTTPEAVTERLLMAAARLGQHRFAAGVLANCGQESVFCGLAPGRDLVGKGPLLASHIKPWRDPTDQDRRKQRIGRVPLA